MAPNLDTRVKRYGCLKLITTHRGEWYGLWTWVRNGVPPGPSVYGHRPFDRPTAIQCGPRHSNRDRTALRHHQRQLGMNHRSPVHGPFRAFRPTSPITENKSSNPIDTAFPREHIRAKANVSRSRSDHFTGTDRTGSGLHLDLGRGAIRPNAV